MPDMLGSAVQITAIPVADVSIVSYVAPEYVLKHTLAQIIKYFFWEDFWIADFLYERRSISI
jgi:hypothetical protein